MLEPDVDTSGMTPAEILRKHNDWRREGEGGMVHPKEMGIIYFTP